jgi:hypothetical protein
MSNFLRVAITAKPLRRSYLRQGSGSTSSPLSGMKTLPHKGSGAALSMSHADGSRAKPGQHHNPAAAPPDGLVVLIHEPESLRVVEIPWGLSPGYAGAELTTAQGSGA